MAGPLEAVSVQAGRKRFSIVEDIYLLREVLATNPFEEVARWSVIAANLNQGLGRNFSVRAVRDRCDLLLGLFKRDDRANLRKSGTEEQYTEKERLLQEISDLARDANYRVRPVPRKATGGSAAAEVATNPSRSTDRAARDAASAAREAAAAAAFQVGQNAAVQRADPDDCQALFMQMLNGVAYTDTQQPAPSQDDDNEEELPPAPTPVLPRRSRPSTTETTRQKRYRESLNLLNKRAEEERELRRQQMALEERRLVIEERQTERRLAIEERQMTLQEAQFAFEKEKFYVLQEAAAEERKYRLQQHEHYAEVVSAVVKKSS